MSVWCPFVLGGLWNAEVWFQPPSLPIEKVLVLVMPFCVWHTHYRVLWKGGRRLELFRLISVLLSTGLTIGRFSTGSALWELVILCCLF